MKKFLKFLIVQFSAIFILMGAFFGAQYFTKVDNMADAAGGDFKLVKLELMDMFEVDTLEFSYKGAKIEYKLSGFNFNYSTFEAKVTLNAGESLDIVNGCTNKEVGTGVEYYYLTKAELVSAFNAVSASINFPQNIPADYNTSIKLSVVVTEESKSEGNNFTNWYFYTIGYVENEGGAVEHNLFRFNTDLDGNIGIEGSFDAGIGYYKSVVNGRTFGATFDNTGDGCLNFMIEKADNITINFNSSNISFPVYLNGERVTDSGDDFNKDDHDYKSNKNIDGVRATLPVYLSDYNSYSFIFNPDEGRLIKKLSLKVGSDEEIFTIYGGMCYEYTDDSGGTPKIESEYYWPDGLTVDEENDLIGVCGNYAFYFVMDGDYVYQFRPADADNAQPRFVITNKDPNVDNNCYDVTLYDGGAIKVNTNTAVKGASFSLESLSFVQVNVKLVTNPGGGELESYNSIALESLKIDGEEVERKGGKIPSTLFKFNVVSGMEVSSTLKVEYNYTETMPAALINGRVFTYVIPGNGEVVNILTKEEDTFHLTIRIEDEDGNLFANSDTKIYIEDIEAELATGEQETFAFSSQMQNSPSGEVTKGGIPSRKYIQIKIAFSPYVMLYDGTSENVLVYKAFNLQIEDNTVVTYVVKNISTQKPVYHNGEEIGSVKIELNSFSSIEDGPVIKNNAVYTVGFKALGETKFTTITHANPYYRGYNFKNLVIDGVNILTEYAGAVNTFGVSATDTSVHKLIAEKVYFADDSSRITAEFTPQLIVFSFEYEGVTYNAKSYFDSYELYIDKMVEIATPGRYFAGIEYTFKSGLTGHVVIKQYDPIVQMESGEFEGLYKYTLNDEDDPWKCEEADALFEVRTEFKHFYIEVVYTVKNNLPVVVSDVEIEYGSNLDVNIITETQNGGVQPVYPLDTIYKYKQIGWKVLEIGDSTTYEVSDDVCDFLINQVVSYEWDFAARIVPVFSKNTIIVTIYDEGEVLVDPVIVRAQEVVDFSKFFFDGENWTNPYKFGYNLVGLTTDPTPGVRLAVYFSWDDGNPVYTPIVYGEDDIFAYDGQFKWLAEENLNFYALYEVVDYALVVDISGSEYARTENFTADVDGSWSPLVGNLMTFTGFDVDTTMTLTGFTPINSDAYIASVRLGYGARGEIVYLDAEYTALCDAYGVVTGTPKEGGGRFDPDYNRLRIIVSEFINTETREALQARLRSMGVLGSVEELSEQEIGIYLDIDYSPVTYMISFTGVFDCLVGGVEEEPDVSDTVYYLVTKDTAKIDKVDEWVVCDENCRPIGGTGWQTIIIPNRDGGILGKESLAGIAGIFIEQAGLTFSFKYWMDSEAPLQLNDDSILIGAYNFTSVFSANFDVTVNYYLYNSAFNGYYRESYEGLFWRYDEGLGRLSLGKQLTTANAYEIYLIGGELYYISNWSKELPVSLKTVAGEDDLDLNEGYEITYSEETIVIDYYAVYKEFDYSVSKTSTEYRATVDIPNDPVGNRYSVDDVIYIKFEKGIYDIGIAANVKTIDIINSSLTTQAKIDAVTLPSAHGVIDDITVESDYYVFAVIQRKTDGEKVPEIYMAVRVTI